MKKKIFSGVQPTGNLHLGNYLGAIKNFVNLNEDKKNSCIFCVVDLHAITVNQDPKKLRDNIRETVATFLASGINSKKSIIFNQSQVSAHSEAAWVLSCIARMGWLNRMTQFKEKAGKDKEKASIGLYSYPVLMAADILLFDTELVPVGKDQKQHLEIARDIAMRFNNFHGDTLVMPEADIEKENQLIPGIDGRKMSKSYNNTIPIFETEKKIRKKIMSVVTDTAGIEESKDKDTPLFQLFSLFLNKDGKLDLSARYEGKGLRYGDVKNELFETVMDYFHPFREKRANIVSKPKEVYEILRLGAKKANLVADKVLDRVRFSTGIDYSK